MSDRVDDRNQRPDYAAGFAYLIEQALLRRRNAQVRTLDNEKSSEVCAALLARQVTLAQHLAFAPGFWTIHVAPLIFRCMTDININLAWISRDAEARSKRFIQFGLGQAKLELEHRRSMRAEEEIEDGASEYIAAMEAWASCQRVQDLVDVHLGSWSGKSTREMAREVEYEEVYEFEYLPMTKFSHIDWISIFALRQVSFEISDPEAELEHYQELDDKTRPNELYLAMKIIIHTFEWYDKATGFCSNDTLQLKQYRDYLRLKTPLDIGESFTNRFIIQPTSGIAAKDSQDSLRQSLAAILEKGVSSIELHIDRVRDVFCEPDTTAVLVPLLDRMASLLRHYIAVPQAWNVHVGPIILRALGEILLIVAWLVGDLSQRSRRFIDASLLQASKDIARLDKAIEERALNRDVKIGYELMKLTIKSLERLFPRERNQRGVPNLRTLAECGDCLDFYNIKISGWSGCVHSSWHHVGVHNLTECMNPLHRFHGVPVIPPVKCDLRYLRSAITCCQTTLDMIDSIPEVGQVPTGPSLSEVFEDEMARIRALQSRHSGKLDDRRHLLGESAITHSTSDSEPIRLLVQVAEQAHVRIQFQLAWIHAQGPAEYRDLVKALVFLTRLMTLAEVDAELEDKIVELRMDVSSKLSAEELSDARERALGGAV